MNGGQKDQYMYTAVITGDIRNSRKSDPKIWLPILKKALKVYGSEPKDWEIYRGDSFQLEVKPEIALEASLYIKACIKQVKNIDVRISIGIGTKEHAAEKISESNGQAFIKSGKAFDELRKNDTIAIDTPWVEVNEIMSTSLLLAIRIANDWSSISAQTVKVSMEHSSKKKIELAQILGTSQNNLSNRIKRSGFSDLMSLNDLYKKIISKQ